MRLISLNTWGGRAGKSKLLDFFAEYKNIDVFCLQEIWAAPYDHLEGHAAGGMSIDHSNIMVHGPEEISTLLDSHSAYFRPHHGDHYGLLVLVKRDLKVVSEGDIFVHKERGYVPEGDVGLHARNVQFITIATEKGEQTIMNFHGLWNGGGKGDSEDRLLQSDRMIEFMKTVPNPFIVCGDFNLMPETQSLRKLENFGLRNLIKEHGITSTRTNFYTKSEKFADYALVSNGITVKDFQVLPHEVSDHSPLYIEIE